MTISSYDSSNIIVPNMRQFMIWTDAKPVHERIYASAGLNKTVFKDTGDITLDKSLDRNKRVDKKKRLHQAILHL